MAFRGFLGQGSVLLVCILIRIIGTSGYHIRTFLEHLNLRQAEPAPIIGVGSSRAELFGSTCGQGIANPLALVASTKIAYCNQSFRNQSGMILYKHYDTERTTQFLIKLNLYRNHSKCRNPGYSPRVFVIFNETSSWKSVEEKISESYISFPLAYSDIYLALVAKDQPTRIMEIFEINNKNFMHEVHISQGFSIESLNSRKRRFRLHGQILRAAIHDKSTNRYRKALTLTFEAMDDMAYMMNFSWTKVHGDGWMGWDYKAKSVTGVSKLLSHGKADIIIQPHELTICRIRFDFDFIFPVYDFGEVVMFRQQEKVYTKLLFQPYEPDSWNASIISLILICFVMCLAYKWDGTVDISVPLRVLGIFTQQGWPENYNGKPAEKSMSLYKKIILATALFLSVFLYNVYSASIISIIQLRQPSITTMDQMLNSERKLIVDSDVRSARRFVLSDSQRMNLYACSSNAMTPGPGQLSLVVSSDEGLAEILNDTSAGFVTFSHFVTKTPTFLNLTMVEFCKVVTQLPVTKRGLPVYEGMYVRKQSPLKRLFIYGHITRAETGAARRQYSTFMNLYAPKCTPTKESLETLSILVVFPAFIMIWSGFVISSVICIAEIIYRNCQRKISQNKILEF